MDIKTLAGRSMKQLAVSPTGAYTMAVPGPPGGSQPPAWLNPNLQNIESHAQLNGKGCFVAVLVLLAFIGLMKSFIVVQPGERAVIFSKISGLQKTQLAEGMHPNIPWLWSPTKYDVKTLTYTMSGASSDAKGESRPNPEGADSESQVPDDSLACLTSDGLPVTVDVSVRFHIDPDEVWRLHQDLGPAFVDKVVRPQTRSAVRMAFGEFSVTDVYSGRRQAIVDRITRDLREEFKGNYLILDEVLLRDIRFPPEFQKAIEDKQVAQQAAQQMVYELDRARSERQQRIIEAQGEAGAIREKAAALAQNPQLVQYEYVHRLPSNTRVLVTDGKTILNLSDLFSGAPPSSDKPEGGGQ